MKEEWQEFRRLSERISADALASFLRAEGVPAHVESPQLVPGVEGYYVVYVQSSLAHRARWLAPESRFSEAELKFMATGELGSNGNQ